MNAEMHSATFIGYSFHFRDGGIIPKYKGAAENSMRCYAQRYCDDLRNDKRLRDQSAAKRATIRRITAHVSFAA
jgi:hypothetical protein